MDYQSFGSSLLSGLISGFFASLVLACVMYLAKPKVMVSKYICRSKTDREYRIKIVNLSRANLVDVKYKLYACKEPMPGVLIYDYVKPKVADIDFIAPYSKADEKAKYAIRIKYDLNGCLSNEEYKFFHFSFSAKHSFTGGVKQIDVDIPREYVVCGEFCTGKTTVVTDVEVCQIPETFAANSENIDK